MRDCIPQGRTSLADEGDLRAQVAADNQRGAADFGDRVQALLVLQRRGARSAAGSN